MNNTNQLRKNELNKIINQLTEEVNASFKDLLDNNSFHTSEFSWYAIKRQTLKMISMIANEKSVNETLDILFNSRDYQWKEMEKRDDEFDCFSARAKASVYEKIIDMANDKEILN